MVWDRQAFRHASEVLFSDLLGVTAPNLPVVSERPDQLLLLGVHANYGYPQRGEGLLWGGEEAERFLPLRAP